MARSGCDVLVLHGSAADDAAVRHLTGFWTWWGHSAVVLTADREPVLHTSSIAHGEPMHSNVQTAWIRTILPVAGEQAGPSLQRLADSVLAGLPASGKAGYADGNTIPADLLKRLLGGSGGGLEWLDASSAVRDVRRIKSSEELSLMRRLGAITAAAMTECMNTIQPGVSERSIATVAHAEAIRRGADAMNFGCFALSGPRTIFKNAVPSDRLVGASDVVVVDLGASLGGYRSDMSRNRILEPVDTVQRRAAEACLAARDAALSTIGPGVLAADVVDAMRGAVREAGLDAWDFSLCHGIGLNLVEAPFLTGGHEVLEPGMVVCVEPIIAPPHVGTMCIEDMVAVTDSGHELLTCAPVSPFQDQDGQVDFE